MRATRMHAWAGEGKQLCTGVAKGLGSPSQSHSRSSDGIHNTTNFSYCIFCSTEKERHLQPPDAFFMKIGLFEKSRGATNEPTNKQTRVMTVA